MQKLNWIFFVWPRILKYRWLSDCRRVSGRATLHQPVLLTGKGRISFGENVQFGVTDSPEYYTGYGFIEARSEDSLISFGNDVSVNNGFSAVAFSNISIGDNVLIGLKCAILDSDGHELAPGKRHSSGSSVAVMISRNVFIGDNVTILKGVSIGENSVIGAGSIVVRDIPENVIAAGNPARVIRNLEG